MKRIVNGALRAIATLSLLAVPLGFVLSGGFASRLLDSILRVRVDPRLSGGEIMATFYDPVGDDKGLGSLSYPASPRFEERGSLDLVKYMVYEPLVDAPWSDEKDFWQLALTLAAMPNPDRAPGGFSLPALRVYIDIDGSVSGSTETRMPRSELVAFDPAFPWDLCVEIEGWRESARLYHFSDGAAEPLEREIPMIVVPERQTIWLRIPLDIPSVQSVLDGRATRHYVMVLASDPVASGGVMPIRAEAGATSGGGAGSSLTPRVYDLLAPKAGAQETMLSSFDEAAYAYAWLEPVVARPGSGSAGPAVELPALKAAFERESSEAKRKEVEEASAALATAVTPIALGVALFRLGRYEEAESSLREALGQIAGPAPERGPRAEAIAYLGSLTAMRGGRAGNPAEAIKLVNEAFALFEEAADQAEPIGGSTLATVLMNRANVAASVPNEVFGKAKLAAEDFRRVAELLESVGEGRREVADAYLRAGLALEAAKLPAEAAFLRALGSPELSAWAAFELAKRGFMRE